MSRKYDQMFLDIPGSIPYEDIVYEGGVGYARIFGYFDYFITTEGDVISFRSREPRLIKQWPTNNGHLYVDLCEKGKKKRYLIHRLVAEAFIPNPHKYPVVRHLDDDPTNNWVKNLAWGTHMDNRQDMIRNDHDYRRAVYCYEEDKYYRSCVEVAKSFGVSRSQVTMCCQGKTHSVRGLHFCYADELDERLKDEDWLRERSPFKPIIAIDRDGNETQFKSRNEAAEKLGIPACGISSVVNGHLDHTHGWRFREAK